MLDFKIVTDSKGKKHLKTSLTGKPLLTTPQLNKGTAFSKKERHEFGLKGKLPVRIETLIEQIKRANAQYQSYHTKLKKNIYLNTLHNTNQVLFYGLVKNHLAEMIPTIYTPIVGTRVKEFSREFRQARGLYISHKDIRDIGEILNNRSNPEIDIIVVTDGESVLGLGDQGVGAMDIPVAKLMIYTLCGGIDPTRTLPILLDVGTNNQELLNDPLYLGIRHPRIRGKKYDAFIRAFVTSVKQKLPKVFLHWEDFGRENAAKNLERFRNQICSFNDDIQGTGVVTLAALLAALKIANLKLTEQRIVVFGAGSAGTGISNQICAAMIKAGLTEKQAREHFWLVDRSGLLTENTSDLTPAQKPYAKKIAENFRTLAEVIAYVKPTILIGTSALSGAFNQSIVQTMAKYVEHPIIFPLSNPTEKAEATPEDLLNWTDGKALIATGSPFENVTFKGQNLAIAQCNNAFAFPGIGLGVIAVKAKEISDNMLLTAAETLCQWTLSHQNSTPKLLPSIEEAPIVSQAIAIAVANTAIREGLAKINKKTSVRNLIAKYYWEPHYLPYKKKKYYERRHFKISCC